MPMALGLRMDAAMTGYWLLLPGLIFSASSFLSSVWVYRLQGFITSLLLFISSLLVIADLELYKHWGFRINATPLMYLESEATSSVNPAIFVLLIILFGVLFISFLLFYWKKLAPPLRSLPSVSTKWSLLWLLVTAALIIPIRSSFSVAPLNTGVVYFHKSKAFPNHAGINPVWNFFKDVTRKENLHYPDHFYRVPELNVQFDSLINTRGATRQLISQEKPNIILIILEGFTSKIIAPLGGLENLTPEFNALTKEGILFENFYASGDRTDKGIVSLLSGYPAQPQSSIIKFPNKTQQLPYLPRILEKAGYHTSFMYGGDIGFANMESYLIQAGFSHITEGDDFDSEFDVSKWGVADHYVFERLKSECDTAAYPFFKVMLSLSSHEPFLVPMETVFPGGEEGSMFLNSCYYTDRSLGDFIKKAKQQPWWKNTLVIITADHGHRFPNPTELKDKERFRIPMLWIGGVIPSAERIKTYAGHTDLANTVLAQAGLGTSPDFSFSKNILADTVTSFALYVFNNGYGYVSPTNETIYDFDLKDYLTQQGNKRELLLGNAYMQKLFDDYNHK